MTLHEVPETDRPKLPTGNTDYFRELGAQPPVGQAEADSSTQFDSSYDLGLIPKVAAAIVIGGLVGIAIRARNMLHKE